MSARSLAVLPLLLIGLCLLHLTVGQADTSAADVAEALLRYDPTIYQHVIIVLQRLTRLVVALYCGAALALSGLLLQKILQNPLVSPSTLGINSGAATFAVLGILAFGLSGGALFWPALLGSATAVGLSFATARLLGPREAQKLNLVLAGSMMGIMFSSITAFVISLDPAAFDTLLSWLVGTIGNFDYQDLPWMAAIGAVAGVAALLLWRAVDVLMMGESQATALGVDVRLVFWAGIGAAVVLAVTSVVVVGPIGFVGLVVPHAARLLYGETGARPVIAALLLGPIVLVSADIVARTLVAPRVLEVGTVMGLLGGAAFLAILLVTLRRVQA